jgi:hypothetical protein
LLGKIEQLELESNDGKKYSTDTSNNGLDSVLAY